MKNTFNRDNHFSEIDEEDLFISDKDYKTLHRQVKRISAKDRQPVVKRLRRSQEGKKETWH